MWDDQKNVRTSNGDARKRTNRKGEQHRNKQNNPFLPEVPLVAIVFRRIGEIYTPAAGNIFAQQRGPHSRHRFLSSLCVARQIATSTRLKKWSDGGSKGIYSVVRLVQLAGGCNAVWSTAHMRTLYGLALLEPTGGNMYDTVYLLHSTGD